MMGVPACIIKLTSYGPEMCQVPNKEFQSLPEQMFLKKGFCKLPGQ